MGAQVTQIKKQSDACALHASHVSEWNASKPQGEVTSPRGLVNSPRGEVTSPRGLVNSPRGEVTSLRRLVNSLRGEVTLRKEGSSLWLD
eukprot:4568922-Pyramimonas_sp.AAC.1